MLIGESRSTVRLFATPWRNPQARIREWVAFPVSRGSSQPTDRTKVSRIAGGFFTSWKKSEVAQSCPTLCNPMDCSPPGSSVHGISQAGIPEWAAISLSTLPAEPHVNQITSNNLKAHLKHNIPLNVLSFWESSKTCMPRSQTSLLIFE